MADLLPARLSPAETVLLHGLCFCAASMTHDDRLGVVVDQMRRALDKCQPRPATDKLRMAAQSICEAFARRNQQAGAADWCLANLKATGAAQDHHWAAFCAVSGG